jgi:hypothetical protein
MKKMQTRKARSVDQDDLLPEYNIDYRKARPNRFAARFGKESVAVVLDPDISRVFTTPESVNTALRALITKVPKRQRRAGGRTGRASERGD